MNNKLLCYRQYGQNSLTHTFSLAVDKAAGGIKGEHVHPFLQDGRKRNQHMQHWRANRQDGRELKSLFSNTKTYSRLIKSKRGDCMHSK